MQTNKTALSPIRQIDIENTKPAEGTSANTQNLKNRIKQFFAKRNDAQTEARQHIAKAANINITKNNGSIKAAPQMETTRWKNASSPGKRLLDMNKTIEDRFLTKIAKDSLLKVSGDSFKTALTVGYFLADPALGKTQPTKKQVESALNFIEILRETNLGFTPLEKLMLNKFAEKMISTLST